MDNVLVNFKSGISKMTEETLKEFEGRLDEIPGIFSLMDPMEGAKEAIEMLKGRYELYILSTAPWLNSSAWSDKILWVQTYFGRSKENPFYKRLIISHHKHLNKGDILIDDRPNNGAKDFDGEWIQFGSEKFPDWKTVTEYLLNK